MLTGLVLAGTVVLGLGGAKAATAAFPGPTGKIVYVRHSPEGNEISSMNPDGSGRTRITRNPVHHGFPDGSPDGTRIAFARFLGGYPDIFVMNADGSGQTNLTKNPASDVLPAWSPDGRRIAFTRFTGGGDRDVYVMNADGSGQTDLTNDPGSDVGPSWSPDGTKIAFASARDGDHWGDIFVMNADGSGQTNLTRTPAQDDSDPDWSPDGRRIAFETQRVGGPFEPDEIFVMNADGSGRTNVTNVPSAYDLVPSWSPDGKRIAFVSVALAVGATFEIFVMNADGSGRTSLTTNPAGNPSYDLDPVWTTLPLASRTCRVPKVVGLRLAGAKQRIRAASCAVGRIRRVRSPRVGRVLAQSPRSGTSLPRGGRVSLVVGRR